MAMFRGQYTHTIDAKGRVSVPSRFRDALGPSPDLRLVLAPALFAPCIDVFPMSSWEEFESRVARMPKFDPDVVRLRRLYVSAAVDCELDKQGRLLVPPQLRDHATLSKDVIWSAGGGQVELWASERWTEVNRRTPEDLDQLKRRMAEWGL
jgi:MraZ protein